MSTNQKKWSDYNCVQRFISEVFLWTVVTTIIAAPLEAIGLNGYGFLFGFIAGGYITHRLISKVKEVDKRTQPA